VTRRPLRWISRALMLGLVGLLVGNALPAAAQTPEPQPPPASDKPRDDRKKEDAPPPVEEPKKKERQEERPRLDAPVSFPVDI